MIEMYSGLANKIAKFLILLTENENSNNMNKDVEVISYGVELLLSSIVNLILVLMIGSYLFGVQETIIFTLLFCPIRQFSGGFHANSYLGCTIGFLVLFMTIGNLINIVNNIWYYFLECIICIGFIGIISPIDTENKRLNKQLRDKCRKKIMIILGIEFFGIVVFFVLLKNKFLHAATMALVIESVLLGLGKIKNKKGVN